MKEADVLGIGFLGEGLIQRKGESFVGFSMEMKKKRQTESQKVQAWCWFLQRAEGMSTNTVLWILRWRGGLQSPTII